VTSPVAPLDDVLQHYPALFRQANRIALGNRGGFSGARLWRLETPAGNFCLRAWPPGDPTPERLQSIHDLMRRARESGLGFVPAVITRVDGATVAHATGHLWDITTWMPGAADFHARPTRPRLEAACAALGLLHRAWAPVESRTGHCPAIQRRLDAYHQWRRHCEAGWRPLPMPGDPIQPVAARAWRVLRRRLEDVPRALSPVAGIALPLQPCLCDIWHDHVLFEGDAVSGLIDFGSVKLDHVAVDLARLLGSMVGDDHAMRDAGLRSYAQIRPLSEEEEALILVLDQTGVLIGMVNWLTWLYHEGRPFEERRAVAQRLEVLVRRAEGWG
jgi:Ser/Thr protein kinase RdoA (MazF antagonist)